LRPAAGAMQAEGRGQEGRGAGRSATLLTGPWTSQKGHTGSRAQKAEGESINSLRKKTRKKRSQENLNFLRDNGGFATLKGKRREGRDVLGKRKSTK